MTIKESTVEKYLNKKLKSYTNKDAFKKLFIEYISSDNIINQLEKISTELEIANVHLLETKSDYAYWNVMSNICLYEDLQEALILFIFDKLKSFDCTETKVYLNAKEDLEKAKNKIAQMIKDLSKYKPSGYKTKIELLKEVLEDDN